MTYSEGDPVWIKVGRRQVAGIIEGVPDELMGGPVGDYRVAYEAGGRSGVTRRPASGITRRDVEQEGLGLEDG